jgi:hypothetical protein
MGFISMAQYYMARPCLAQYRPSAIMPSEAGLGILDSSPRLRDALLTVIQGIDLAAMLLIVTPGGAIRYGVRRILPKLAASAALVFERHAMMRAVAAATQAPAWVKATLTVAGHVGRDPSTFWNMSVMETFRDWYGFDRAYVTIPATAAIIAGGIYVTRLPGGHDGLQAAFSLLLGKHYADRAALSRQKDSLHDGDQRRAAIDRELERSAGLSTVIMGVSGGAALLGGDWGQILCLVDDVMPGIVAALK